MRICILLGSIALLLTGCGSFAAGPGGGDAHVGAQLYVKYGCLNCHGTNGQGPNTPDLARDLTNDYSEANYALLRYFLQIDPPKGMEYTKALPWTPRQIADLNAFDNNSSLRPVKAAAAPPPAATATAAPRPATSGPAPPKPPATTKPRVVTVTTAGNPRNGARLWVSTRCVQCHKINGGGGTIGRDLTHSPTMTFDAWRALARNPQQPPGMAYVPGLHLTDQQIRDMSAFADSSLTPGP